MLIVTIAQKLVVLSAKYRDNTIFFTCVAGAKDVAKMSRRLDPLLSHF
jgi:hypothetical protein